VSRGRDALGLPGVSDDPAVAGIVAAYEQPGSVHCEWWTHFTLPLRQIAERKEGELRPCTVCAGRGGQTTTSTCSSCNGNGFHAKRYRRPVSFSHAPLNNGGFIRRYEYEEGYKHIPCTWCKGTGRIISEYQCADCSNTGNVKYSARDVYEVDSRALVREEARRRFGNGTEQLIEPVSESTTDFATPPYPSFELVSAMVATFVMLATWSIPPPSPDSRGVATQAAPTEPAVRVETTRSDHDRPPAPVGNTRPVQKPAPPGRVEFLKDGRMGGGRRDWSEWERSHLKPRHLSEEDVRKIQETRKRMGK
jgi:hypothetical protein